jgi:steroid delta-isomerase-like uncharacterized protein
MAQAKDLLEREYQALNAHDALALAGLYSDDAEVSAPGGARMTGGKAVAQFASVYLKAFPDGNWKITNIIEGADSGAVETVFHGTHTGTLKTPSGDVPPTGRKVANEVVSIARAEDGRIVAERLYFDQLALMMQLGLVPEPQA